MEESDPRLVKQMNISVLTFRAVLAFKLRYTCAAVVIHMVAASATILTWIGFTVIDVLKKGKRGDGLVRVYKITSQVDFICVLIISKFQNHAQNVRGLHQSEALS